MRCHSMPMNLLIIALSWAHMQALAFALTVEESISVMPVSSNHNDIMHIRREVDYIVDCQTSPDDHVTVHVSGLTDDYPVVNIKVSGFNLTEAHLRNILETVKRYALLRADGHSEQFATYVILHGNDRWPIGLRRILALQPLLKESVAFPW